VQSNLKNVQVLVAENDERTMNDEPRTNELIGPNLRLVQIPIDWYEFRSIGPNSERLVRIPNDWSKFRTIGPNPERLVRIPNDWSENVKVLAAQKKSSWTDLDRVSFQKKFSKSQTSKFKNRRGLI
jgi:hypothetical protein